MQEAYCILWDCETVSQKRSQKHKVPMGTDAGKSLIVNSE